MRSRIGRRGLMALTATLTLAVARATLVAPPVVAVETLTLDGGARPCP